MKYSDRKEKSSIITGRDPATGESIQVTVENGRIQAIETISARETGWLSPGFIDLQVNGYLGSDINVDNVDPDVVIALTQKMLSVGVTTYLPTIITASEEKIIHALRAVAEARKISPLVAHAVPYVHVEGPYIAAEDGPRGAHDRNHVRPPSLAEFDRWQAASGNLVGMVTISPHSEQALEYIASVSSRGVVVALGHSSAAPEKIHAAAAAGAKLSTHLGNGLGSPLPRHPNLLWAQLADDRLTATFIADGHHLPMDTLKAMLRAKTVDRSVLVSDAVSLGGMPAGIYRTDVGGDVEVTADGRVAGGPPHARFLAGAYLPLMDGISNTAQIDGFSLGDAVRMATENPGRFAGGRGQLRPGADADLVRFQWTPGQKLKIETVWVQGEPC
jgi:N-acetylglucosamine-6-phosphate deacetylase